MNDAAVMLSLQATLI